ncbi:MAG TPA: histidine kinase [Candidatus Binatia bacterium]|nr:histidine kinase [Candidatus Binatia bacterium]
MTPARSQFRRWLWVAAIWTGVALFDATQTVFVMRAQGMHHYWGYLFLTLVLFWLPWALATPFLAALGRKYPPTQWKLWRMWVSHIAAFLAIGVISAAWSASLEILLNPWAFSPPPNSFAALFLTKCFNWLLAYAILYSIILFASQMLDSRERLAREEAETARLNEQLSQAQLSALRRQIEPHFLFNTLNAVAGLVREGRNDAAVIMIAELSDFLRRVVNDSDRQQVPLSEELDFTRKYLDIQKARFADRLRFSLDVPADLLPAQVPSLILQPMVENAIKHGIDKRAQGGSIRISAFRSSGALRLLVYNDGPALPPEWNHQHSGIGISNVQTRLQNLYGRHFQFDLQNRNGGVEVSLSLPLTLRQSRL